MNDQPPIVVSIDVTKIDKSRLFPGAKGTYLELILIATPGNKFGADFLVRQTTKNREERLPPIGNARILKPLAEDIPF